MNVEKKVPEIRFKGFSGEWLENPIGEICGATFGGGTPSTSESNFWQGDIPWIQSSDLKEGSVSSVNAKKHITKAAVNKSATKLVSGNSIAIVTRVGVGKLSLMKAEYATSQDFLSLSDLKVDTQYSAYAIWKLLQVEKEQVQGTSIKGITKEELLSKTINYPNIKLEQTAIGNYFQKLDSLINRHQQKHDQLSNIKKAMLEKMFPKPGETTPEIRFKGFSGEWEERSWCDTVDISTNMVDPRNNQYGELLHVGPGNIESFTGRFYDNVLRVKDSNLISGKFYFNKGDIIYGKINPQLAKYVIAPFEGLASADAYVLNTKNGVVQSYLFTVLHSEDFYKYTVSVSSRTGMPKINRDELSIYSYMAPNEHEQTAIGNYFQKLDALINQHQQQITKLTNIKQAFLRKMFV